MRLIWFLVIVLAGLVAAGLFTAFEGTAPDIRTRTNPAFVGPEYIHEFRVADQGRGVERIRIWIESGERSIDLHDETYPGSLLLGATNKIVRRVEVPLRPADLGIPEGRATLVAEALDYSWRGNRSRVEVPLTIDSKAPRLAVQTGLTYVRRGGSELVSYSVNEDVPEHGVRIGDLVSSGFPHPADPDRFVAFYPLPPDIGPGTTPEVFAQDRAGNRTRSAVAISIIERSFPTDHIALSRDFLDRKVPEILGGEHEDLLSSYLKINRDLRQQNEQQIREICQASSEERLWRGAFLQLPNSNVGARFAEQRTYSFEGEEVDRQVHLGYDLASTARSPVPAANSGVVAFAGDLGIYGQTVIIDHGLGLFSLYGHLSEIAVEKGQVAAQGEPIGRTGETGLAGGDHLHYGMMVAGVFVDPLEWFDARWIQEHIEVELAVSVSEANGAQP